MDSWQPVMASMNNKSVTKYIRIGAVNQSVLEMEGKWIEVLTDYPFIYANLDLGSKLKLLAQLYFDL